MLCSGEVPVGVRKFGQFWSSESCLCAVGCVCRSNQAIFVVNERSRGAGVLETDPRLQDGQDPSPMRGVLTVQPTHKVRGPGDR